MTMRSVVVLPAPFGPSSPKTLPRGPRGTGPSRHVAGEGLPYPLEYDGLVVHGLPRPRGFYTLRRCPHLSATRRAGSRSSRSARWPTGSCRCWARWPTPPECGRCPCSPGGTSSPRCSSRSSNAESGPGARAHPPVGDRLRLRLQLGRLLPRPGADPGVRDRLVLYTYPVIVALLAALVASSA